jgi:hypothetical protein
MNRWILTIDGKDYQPKIYADTKEEAAKYFPTEKIIKIEPYTDKTYLTYINLMREKSYPIKIEKRRNWWREWRQRETSDFTIIVRFYRDSMNDGCEYLDRVDYQVIPYGKLNFPVTFDIATVSDNLRAVYEKYFLEPMICEIYSHRIYGEPKLDKPHELKGIKPAFSVGWLGDRAKIQFFIKDNDLWLKHRDFFSKSFRPPVEDIGAPLDVIISKYFPELKQRHKKFVYTDAWGEVVLRNEAWIVFKNFVNVYSVCKSHIVDSLKRSFLRSDFLKSNGIYDLEDSEWNRFFEAVNKEYAKILFEREHGNMREGDS